MDLIQNNKEHMIGDMKNVSPLGKTGSVVLRFNFLTGTCSRISSRQKRPGSKTNYNQLVHMLYTIAWVDLFGGKDFNKYTSIEVMLNKASKANVPLRDER